MQFPPLTECHKWFSFCSSCFGFQFLLWTVKLCQFIHSTQRSIPLTSTMIFNNRKVWHQWTKNSLGFVSLQFAFMQSASQEQLRVSLYCTCANETIMFVAVSVITFTEFPWNVPFLGWTDALSTVAGTWNHKDDRFQLQCNNPYQSGI